MKNKFAFSLAEALITLLIVCIIAIVSAPMITKKAKRSMRTEFWQKDSYADSAVSVRNGYDVRFGTESEKEKNQSIVVIGTLYFKDRNGKVIGWISEDGSNSFTTTCPSVGAAGTGVDQQTINQLMQMVRQLYSMLGQQRGATASGSYSGGGSYGSSGYSSGRTSSKRIQPKKIQPKKIQPKKIQAPSAPSVPSFGGYKNTSGISPDAMNMDPSQMQSALQGMDQGELQQMMNQLMQMFPAQ